MKERGYLSRTGPDGEVLFPVDGTLFIGSGAGCEVAVRDAAPRHCQIARTSEGFVALDLTGQRLVRVNGTRVERHLLREGELLAVGSSEFRWTVIFEEEAAVVAVEPVRKPTRVRVAPVAAPKPRSSQRPLVIGGIAAAVLVISVVVVFASNTDRTVRRDKRPVRPGNFSPSPVPEVVAIPAAAAVPEPRPEPAPVVAVPEPARIVVTPLPEVPAPVLPAANAPLRARPASPFDAQYAALIQGLERTLARGWGYEAAYKEILEFSTVGGPKGMADHLRALAASLKAAVACRECAGGKVGCERCGGKGRVDLDCTVCQGQGRVRAAGAVGAAEVTVRCRNCEGSKVFKGVTCPACARSGKATCAACRGKVWPADRCPRPECDKGRLPCPTCGGKAFEIVKCPFCVNGRRQAPGAVNGADVTMKCRNCEIDGAHGSGNFKVDCKACGKTGKVTCDHCGGAYSSVRKSAAAGRPVETGPKAVSTARVFTAEKCRDCSGAGCDDCFGLGLRVRPVGR